MQRPLRSLRSLSALVLTLRQVADDVNSMGFTVRKWTH